MKSIEIPKHYNYIGVFLTFSCNLRCSYCINYFNDLHPSYKILPWQSMVKGLNRLDTREDLPITLQGGEPSCHPDFYNIVNGIRRSVNVDLLTNAQFNIDRFISNIDKDRLRRDAKYASIRVSYHIESMSLEETIRRVDYLHKKGYSVGIWCVNHPRDSKLVSIAKELASSAGIDFRVKEFLGWYNGKLYGTYKYPSAIDGIAKKCMCKPSELLIAPSGTIFRCHRDLYTGENSYGHILDKGIKLVDRHMVCSKMGECNPCDIKVKFNRYQELGHCAVDIKEM